MSLERREIFKGGKKNEGVILGGGSKLRYCWGHFKELIGILYKRPCRIILYNDAIKEQKYNDMRNRRRKKVTKHKKQKKNQNEVF